jgi:prefoldin subunit 5
MKPLDMGFWAKTFQVVQDVTSLGGTYRMRAGKERYQQLIDQYESIRAKVANLNREVTSGILTISNMVRISTKRLDCAQRMLNPLTERAKHGPSLSPQRSLIQRSSGALAGSNRVDSLGEYVPIVAGAGVGAASVAASWGSAQLIAHASTGTAMAALHGAAAANAGWAWFGGGSLAVGGGGMAAGHLILPGIGTAIAVAVSTTIAHKEANRLADECDKIEGANRANSQALQKLNSDVSRINQLKGRLQREDDMLAIAVDSARASLFRSGKLSHFIRLLRYWFKGYYYKVEELKVLERLDESVVRFVSAFRDV